LPLSIKSNKSYPFTNQVIGFYTVEGSIVHDQRELCEKTKKGLPNKILLDLVLTGHEWMAIFKGRLERFTVLF